MGVFHIIFYLDPLFTSRSSQTLQEILGKKLRYSSKYHP